MELTKEEIEILAFLVDNRLDKIIEREDAIESFLLFRLSKKLEDERKV